MELKDFRRQYTQGGLQRASLPQQPLALFEQWQADAAAAGLPTLPAVLSRPCSQAGWCVSVSCC